MELNKAKQRFKDRLLLLLKIFCPFEQTHTKTTAEKTPRRPAAIFVNQQSQ
jgi:hypothetical protein